ERRRRRSDGADRPALDPHLRSAAPRRHRSARRGRACQRPTVSGALFLVPNGLDVGTGEADHDLRERLPLGTIRIAAHLGHWVCENAKTTRAFLKRVDAACKLERPLQAIEIVELPRPPKGRPDTAAFDGARLLAPALAGGDLGLVCEAGLPAVA